MLLSSNWLSALKLSFRGQAGSRAKRGGRRGHKAQVGQRVAAERLEPRCLLSGYSFVKIADSAAYPNLGNSPALSENGQVAFKGSTSTDNFVLKGSGAALTEIASSTGSLFQFGSPSINANGTVVFWALADDPGIQVIATGDGSAAPTTLVTGSSAAVTGEFEVLDRLPDINDSGDVSFMGDKPEGTGVFHRAVGGTITMLAQESDGYSPFAVGETFTSLNNADGVSFNANLANGDKVIVEHSGPGGTRTNLRDSSGPLNAFSRTAISQDGDVLSSVILDTGAQKLIRYSNAGAVEDVQVVAATTDFLQFEFPNLTDNSGGMVFRGVLDSGAIGIYTGTAAGSDPVANKVIENGATLGGKEISSISMSSNAANSHGQIAFFVTFTDSSFAIYRADPVLTLDWGDLPETATALLPGGYKTTASSGGPSHVINPNLTIGHTEVGEPADAPEIDAEFDGNPTANADGDDTTGINDEGTFIRSVPRQLADPANPATRLNVELDLITAATNLTGGAATLYTFMDFTRDGDFDDPGETQTQDIPNGTVDALFTNTFTINTFTISDLPTSASYSIAVRYRLSTQANLGPNGPAPDGEVEDGIVRFDVLFRRDWGDLPEMGTDTLPAGYKTTFASGGPSHLINPALTIGDSLAGLEVDVEADGHPNADADGDNTDGLFNDEANLVSRVLREVADVGNPATGLKVELLVSTAATNLTGGAATLYAFMDFTRDGDFDDPGETQTQVVPSGTVEARFHNTFTISGLPVASDSYSIAVRYRLSTQTDLGPNGTAPDGEVEDDIVRFDVFAGAPKLKTETTLNVPKTADEGTTVTLTATVTPTTPSNDVPTGSVEFVSVTETACIVVGADAGSDPTVQVLEETGKVSGSFNAYPTTFRGGVRVAMGDVTGDGMAEIITAPGPGGDNTIKIFVMSSSGSQVSFMDLFHITVSDPLIGTRGLQIATGDLNGDGFSDIIVSGGPKVFAYSGKDFSLLHELTPFGTSASEIRVAVGDLIGDGTQHIVAATGPNAAPSIKVFDSSNGSLLRTIAPFESTFRGGVNLAVGDINGDGIAEIIAAKGAGSTPQVKVFDAKGVFHSSFMAFDVSSPAGVRVAAADLDGDGVQELIVDPAAVIGTSQLKVFRTNGDKFALEPAFVVNAAATGFLAASRTNVVVVLGTAALDDDGIAALQVNDLRSGVNSLAARYLGSPAHQFSVSLVELIELRTLMDFGDAPNLYTGGYRYYGDNPLLIALYNDFLEPPNALTSRSIDFGYRTLLLNDGARHRITSTGPILGTSRDGEIDGQQSRGADGDDLSPAGTDDEDGVTFLSPVLFRRDAFDLASSVTIHASAAGFLDAFIDFGCDGAFDNEDQLTGASIPVVAGDNLISFTVPGGEYTVTVHGRMGDPSAPPESTHFAPLSRAGETFARFRISSAGGLSADGEAADGEVEDYPITIRDFKDSGGRSSPAMQIPLPSQSSSGGSGFASFDIFVDGGLLTLAGQSSGGDRSPLFQMPFDGRQRLEIMGTAGDDTLRLDLSNSNATIPNFIAFDGGGEATAAGDSLEIIGGPRKFDRIDFSYTNFKDGLIELDGTQIQFADLEPIVLNTVVDHLAIYCGNTTGNDDRLTDFNAQLDELPIRPPFGPHIPYGVIQFSGTARSLENLVPGSYPFEKILAVVPRKSLTVNLSNGTDSLVIAPSFPIVPNSVVVSIRGLGGNDTIMGNTFVPLVIDGGLGDDSITGGYGNDIVIGGDGRDQIDSRSGNDAIFAGSGNDNVRSGDGNDSIDGESGNDFLLGQSGDDVIHTGAGTDMAAGGGGNDVVTGDFDPQFRNFGDSLFGNDGNDTLEGTEFDDELSGGDGNDAIDGHFGNDLMRGDAGDDSLNGGVGNDQLIGDEGNDVLNGQAGDDLLDGGTGNDSLDGGDGGDQLDGRDGDDSLTGGAGVDIINGDAGADTINGGAGADLLRGGIGNDVLNDEDGATGESDTLFGDVGNDILHSSGGADVLVGGTGDDQLDGGIGADTISGEDGNDTIFGGDGDDSLNGGSGTDQITGGTGNDSAFGGDGDDRIFGDAGLDSLEGGEGRDVIDGGVGNDQLIGGEDNDTISGGQGNDLLVGDEDNDSLNGGDGDDTVLGGDGDDVVLGGNGNDSVGGEDGDDRVLGQGGNDTVSGGEGVDTIDGGTGLDAISEFTSRATLANTRLTRLNGDDDDEIETLRGIERAQLSAAFSLVGASLNASAFRGSVTLFGSGFNDTLTGGAAADSIDSGFGNDNIVGGAGNDTLNGGDDADMIKAGDGNDSINGGDGKDTLCGERGRDTISGGVGNDSIEGDIATDSVAGTFGNDSLLGDAGNDTIRGGFGDDVLKGGADNDSLFGNRGNDLLNGGSGNDVLEGDNATDTLLATAGNDSLTGQVGDDTLRGFAGNDVLVGGTGKDKLEGGDGNDTLLGGADNDTIDGGLGTDIAAGGSGANTFVPLTVETINEAFTFLGGLPAWIDEI